MKRACVFLILILSFCGLSDAVYLAQNEAENIPLICNVSSLSGCNIVAASPYSHVFGVSIAEYGVVFYSVIFIIAALEIALSRFLLRRVLQGMSLIGVIVSIFLTLIEIFVIKALCIFCIASAIIALLILVASYFIEPVRKVRYIV